jgi:hypothetical protein
MASTTSGSITINADAIRRFLPVSVVLVVMVVLVSHDNSSSLRSTVLRQRELQKTITAADYFGTFSDDSENTSSFEEPETEAPTFNQVPAFQDVSSDSTANNFGEVPLDGATDDMITPADEFMMEGSEVPSFGQQATDEPMFPNKVSATADQVGTDAPTDGLSEDSQGFIVETGFDTIAPTDALGFTAEEAQDNAAIQESTGNFVPDTEDVFSAALLFTDVPTEDFTSGDSFDLVPYEINTKVVMDIDIGWQSGIIEWYDAASDNYGVLWSATGQTQIFAAGKTFDDMVNMGRDDELFALGSTLDAAAIAKIKNRNKNNNESDKGTIIGLSIMGVSMIALMIVAAVVLRRRSSIKRGKSVPLRNLNDSYRDDDEGFHDEPLKPPTGLFQDHEPAGFLTVEGQIIQEGISGVLGDPDLFPDNPELYRESI